MINSELRAKRETLEALWQKGLSGQALLTEHTKLIDSYLHRLFSESVTDNHDMALIALGGYGRGELFPFSDIDLLLLHRTADQDRLTKVAENLFYPLWDAGLEVGHGVRTIDNCLEDAQSDFFFQVSLLDARLVAGSQVLFDELMETFRRLFVHNHRKEFFETMLSHCRLRHERFGNHGYLLEPDIKESRCGFRDAQAMLWSAQVVFGLNSLDDLENSALLTSDDRQRFAEAVNNLTRIRNRLHYISGRKNDRLFFEHQEEMAEAFDYPTTKAMLGVELFMRDVHNHLQTIAVTTDLFFEHVQDVVGLTPPEKGDRTLESGIAVRQGRIQLIDSELVDRRPHLLMRVFYLSGLHDLPIHHNTKTLISRKLPLVTDKVCRSKRMSKAFLAILQGDKAGRVLSDMLETGLLSAYIPEFEHLESLAQHDVYHVYTVDRHLLQCVTVLGHLKKEEAATFITLAAPHILFLAALLHDIGKGTSHDHSEYGADLVRLIGKRLNLSKEEIDCLAFLIRHHLFLATIALRRDIEDDTLIHSCAETIQDQERLAMLYLLTIADAEATGPTVLTEWKSALFLELYLKIAHALEYSEPTAPDQQQAVAWLRDKLTPVARQLAPDFDLDVLPDDYILSFATDEVALHIKHHGSGVLQKRRTVVEATDQEDHWRILVMAPDRRGLLNRLCGVLALHNIKVLAAKIFTWADGTAVDVLHVTSALNKEFTDQDWQTFRKDLELALDYRLGLGHRLERKLTPTSGKTNNKKTTRPKVTIEPDGSDKYTIIEVFAEDNAVLLYNITRALADFGISTYRAQIGSQADQVVDVFYVLDHEGHKIHDKDFMGEIRQELLYAAY
ncbi:MAG: [protein-PII] uridylyltransferase [Desulfobulbaceae bacterium]|nr:MAG: [protein-PII] uridylyltransferase [Desulfobulbaceae bacterium]